METPISLKSEWLDAGKLFAFPDWAKIHQWVNDTVTQPEHGRVYNRLVREWMERVARGFPFPMEVAESAHFVVLLPKGAGNSRATLAQLEDYRVQILQALAGLDLMEWSSRIAVVIAPDQTGFTRYLSDYYNDGEHMLPGGVCLRRGYVHFVLPDANLATSTSVLAHELTHVCVTGIPWPLWVEEAVVQAIEHKLSQRNPYVLNREMIGRHRRFWKPEKVQDFWTGASFNYPNEGSELSYHLCRFLLEGVAQHGRGTMMEFLRQADAKDSGCAAMLNVLGIFPSEMLGELLGDGDWAIREMPGEV